MAKDPNGGTTETHGEQQDGSEVEHDDASSEEAGRR